MRLGINFKVGRFTSVYVSKYPTKKSCFDTCKISISGIFLVQKCTQSDVKMSLVSSGIWRRVYGV